MPILSFVLPVESFTASFFRVAPALSNATRSNRPFFKSFCTLFPLLIVGSLMMWLLIPMSSATVQAAESVEQMEALSSVSINIPAIDVEAAVVTVPLRQFPDGSITWDVSTITSEVGYMEGTAWFNDGGNTVLGAHSELGAREPGVFYELDKLQPGDHIYVQESDQSWHYIVTDVLFVSSNDVSVVYPTTNERLTLLTCDTDTYSDGAYSGRVVVIAERAA